MAKIYDETYTFNVFTEDGQRWVECSHGGAIRIIKPFTTREELNKNIGDYIEDVDRQEEYTSKWGF